MENLNTDQINEYIAALGSNIRVDESSFLQINASGEAQYKVKVNGKDNMIFIRRLRDGNLRASINTLV
jgi:hypothetical protein